MMQPTRWSKYALVTCYRINYFPTNEIEEYAKISDDLSNIFFSKCHKWPFEKGIAWEYDNHEILSQELSSLPLTQDS